MSDWVQVTAQADMLGESPFWWPEQAALYCRLLASDRGGAR